MSDGRFDLDLLHDDPFEVDRQTAHPSEHARLGTECWLCRRRRQMMATFAKCCPIGCYEASKQLAVQYRRNR